MTRPRVALYIAMTLDGYIARTDGAFDWLSAVEQPGEDYGYRAFYDSVDAVVMGRGSFDVCARFSSWPYPDRPSYVFTTRGTAAAQPHVEFVSGAIAPVLEHLAAQGHRRVWLLGGGVLARAFQAEGVLDEYIISVVPMLLGSGLRMFPSPWMEERLRLVESRSYPSGLVQGTWVPAAVAGS